MATIVTRVSKGSPLTITEMDSNFTNLNADKADPTQAWAGTAANATNAVNATKLSQIITAGANYIYYDADIISGSYTSAYTEVKNCQITQSGTFRISFELAGTVGNDSYARVYKNGIAFGTVRVVANSGTYQTFTEDLTFAVGDTVQIYANTQVAPTTTYVKNFKVGISLGSNITVVPTPTKLPLGAR